MPGLARFVLGGPMQAALVAAALLVCALVLPPVVLNLGGAGAMLLLALVLAVALLVSAASIALVWLRKPSTEAVATVLIGFAGAGILSWVSLGSAMPAVFLSIALWLPVIPLAWVLRTSVRLELAVYTAALMGIAVAMASHVALGDPAAFWLERLQGMFARPEAADGMAMSQEQYEAVMRQVAGMMTGIMVSSLLMNALSSLFLARWWQARLFNPGGFRQEFHALRLGRPANVVLALSLAIGLFAQVQLANTIAVVMLFVAMLQGLAVAHGLVAARGMGRGWLVGIYVLIGLVPHTALILALLGILDSWVDFRERARRAAGS